MKNILLLIGFSLLINFSFAQQTINSRQVDDFRVVELTGNLTVELIQSDIPGVDIKLNNTTIEKLDWGVKNGVLSIRLKPGGGTGSADVKLYYEDISDLKISKASAAFVEVFSRVMLDVNILAGGTLSGELDVKDLSLKVTGNSAADISGKAKYYNLSASGKSKVNSRNLECMDVTVSSNSGAEVYIFAEERLQITSATGGSVYYKGEPEIYRGASKVMGTINNIGK